MRYLYGIRQGNGSSFVKGWLKERFAAEISALGAMRFTLF